MEDLLSTLRERMYQYRDLDNKRQTLNKEVVEVRNQLNKVETDIIEIIKKDEFNKLDKLQYKDDGSVLNIKTPSDVRYKGWTISKKELEKYINEYFEGTVIQSGPELFEYIVSKHKEKLRVTSYEILRANVSSS